MLHEPGSGLGLLLLPAGGNRAGPGRKPADDVPAHGAKPATSSGAAADCMFTLQEAGPLHRHRGEPRRPHGRLAPGGNEHIGIVRTVSGSSFTTVEGNTGNPNGGSGGVYIKSRSKKSSYAFIRVR